MGSYSKKPSKETFRFAWFLQEDMRKKVSRKRQTYHSYIIETSSAEIICESLSNIFRIVKGTEDQRTKDKGQRTLVTSGVE